MTSRFWWSCESYSILAVFLINKKSLLSAPFSSMSFSKWHQTYSDKTIREFKFVLNHDSKRSKTQHLKLTVRGSRCRWKPFHFFVFAKQRQIAGPGGQNAAKIAGQKLVFSDTCFIVPGTHIQHEPKKAHSRHYLLSPENFHTIHREYQFLIKTPFSDKWSSTSIFFSGSVPNRRKSIRTAQANFQTIHFWNKGRSYTKNST